jgi:hypothetical protein
MAAKTPVFLVEIVIGENIANETKTNNNIVMLRIPRCNFILEDATSYIANAD